MLKYREYMYILIGITWSVFSGGQIILHLYKDICEFEDFLSSKYNYFLVLYIHVVIIKRYLKFPSKYSLIKL